MEFASLIFFFIIVIPSAIIHEYFHGVVANYFGDPTAKYAGRLTLNPIAHVDPLGTILMPLFLFLLSGGSFVFAYAKPVPVNPLYLRTRYASPLVALAGPFANFLTAAALGIVIRFLPPSSFVSILGLIVYANILLGVFNLLPMPPLDGSKVIFPFLPPSWIGVRLFFEQFGFIFLLVFLIMGFHWLYPLIIWLYRLFVGMPLSL